MSTPTPRITFDFERFITRFPEFKMTPATRAQAMFDRAAAALLDNTGGSPVMDDGVLEELFFLLVAHLCTLFPCAPGGAARAGGSTRPPGTMTSASEGTVSSSFSLAMPSGSAMAPWFMQTEYGLEFWTATAPYRSARYSAHGNSGVGYSRNFIAGPWPFGGFGSQNTGGM